MSIERMYLMYKRYDGELNDIKEYEKRLDIFIKHTYMSYVGGLGMNTDLWNTQDYEYDEKEDRYYYKSREDSIKGFIKEAKISEEEAYIVFNRVDSVTCYT